MTGKNWKELLVMEELRLELILFNMGGVRELATFK